MENRQFSSEQDKLKQKLKHASTQFNTYRVKTRITTSFEYRASVELIEKKYNAIKEFNNQDIHFASNNTVLYKDLATNETYNIIQLYNSLNEIDEGDIIDPSELHRINLGEKLDNISMYLDKRWNDAVLNSINNNPKSVRNYCISIHEILINILDIKAPENDVRRFFKMIDFYTGQLSLEFKIKYLLNNRSTGDDSFVDFLVSDIHEMLVLCRTIIDYTQKKGAEFTAQQLLKLEKRVGNTIGFLAEL